MKPHPKLRKTIKWGGAVVTLLLVVVWAGSGFLQADKHIGAGVVVALGGGEVSVMRMSEDQRDVWVYAAEGLTGWMPYRMHWGLYYTSKEPPRDWSVTLPMWPFAFACLFATVTAWRLDGIARRRARLNLCPKCGYDRAGIAADAKCPECGTKGAA
ncbi:MAG TPA: hypothetical protein VHC70_02865 [Phycisphaerales bacterium]|nr:hypothetical protein [Phycisphaerales bacterium]